MESGQTLAIGGLIEHRSQTNMRKVPFLGDLPFLGTAFSSKFNNETEVELLFLVTPHLVDPMSCDQAPKVLPGQETRVPDDFELYLEGIQEAPRGCRDVFVNHHYLAAYKNSPTVGTYPCCPGCPQHGHGPIGAGAGCGCGGGGNEAVGVSGVVTSTVSTPVVGTVNEVAPPPAHPVAAGHVQRTTAPTVVPALPVSSSLPMGMESGAYPVQKPLPAPVGAAGNP
jgi:pilus assembly protein CpaC